MPSLHLVTLHLAAATATASTSEDAPPSCRLQAVFLLIGKTSALTMNIAGVIKDWMLIFFSYYLFGAPVTALSLLGYGFCCTGVRFCLSATAFWAASACARCT